MGPRPDLDDVAAPPAEVVEAPAAVPPAPEPEGDHEAEKPNAEEIKLPPVDGTAPIQSSSGKDTTPMSRAFSDLTSTALDMAKTMTNPRNIRNFIFHIVLNEILVKQLPLALALALPAICIDALIGLGTKPQNELVYEDEAHRLAGNATFNVHFDYNPGPQVPGVLGSAVAGNICFLVALYGWFTWTLIYIPYCVLSKEQFKEATPKRFLAGFAFLLVIIPVMLFIGGVQARKLDGGHHYALVGSLSPAIPVIVIYAAITVWRGMLINRVTKTNLWLVGLNICVLTAVTLTLEVIYVVGLSGMPMKRKELIIFLYRALIWPLIWYVILVPLFRYVLLMTGGNTTNVIPYLGFVLSITSVSSRTVMYSVDNELFFMILAIEDALLQSAFNFHMSDQPLLDQIILQKLWRRCIRLSDTGEVVKHNDSRARMMRMFWFQCQSVVELTVVFTQTFRTWAFYESRHVFANMFRPTCKDGFDWESTLTKLGISVAMITFGDLASSYFIYCKGFPLAEAFKILLRSSRSWISFSFMNVCGFCLLAMTMIPVIGRVGRCTDFGNGCTCGGLVVYKELCGCCGLSPEQAAASSYAICQL